MTLSGLIYAALSMQEVQMHTNQTNLSMTAVVSESTQLSYISEGDWLLYNGEIFDGLEVEVSTNDGSALFERLVECKGDATCLVTMLDSLDGPFAVVFYSAASQTVFCARDPLGRRSLLVLVRQDCVLITSCVPQHLQAKSWQEVPTDVILTFDIQQRAPFTITKIPRRGPTQITTELPISLAADTSLEQAARALLASLRAATRARCTSLARERSVAILFSGGLDCTTLALLADEYIHPSRPIDLLNVAFENPRTVSLAKSASRQWDVPDRLTGLATLTELRNRRPNRDWRFVAVNVPFAEYQSHVSTVLELMFPSNSVMDLSIAIALYFASRGIGQLQARDGSSQPYTSESRVLLSGLGADEQLGGYARHRRAFDLGTISQSPAEPSERNHASSKQDWLALVQELQLDLDRIGHRNLGRDDRVISSHGKEVRFPFLAANVISALANTPVNLKCNPALGPGIGDKLVLRYAARELLGLQHASKLPKRAIQFGARTAKMDSSKEQGHHVVVQQ
ncbi:uncharacterized protein L969DRAFT_95639 [Mixia osmundae IAM 14324]|uniref:Glutamine amidotransferase type-2 domain-containing protein n=1 Tax=Mixia osmundae (strain CBS 9802 / IAM 14324 / JCM 22182 / KY 12970) TaxID=764103 RepID=G7E804_MIXOS|nr:uncharacterized protein L969DRAFT_95639 [Mixia osmundae IAM 14324]KEI38563.1 hypothetical protein L969DRAFT_95639 [Mixia osmundae IAM 14324]GAA98964.1 hypothetical protein E5Q_05652 [Mixia osmundae IAM 14324]